MNARVLPSADVDDTATLGEGTTVWHLAQVREGARLGARCIVGRGAYVGTGVRVGDDVKIQNHALVYEPAEVEDGVFIGPAVVLTNDRHPRAVNPDGGRKAADDWEPAPVRVRHGASLGAGAVVLAGVTIGRWALVGAGAVVLRDVPAFGLVVGNPARHVGWVGRSGRHLDPDGTGTWQDPVTGDRFTEVGGALQEVGQ